MFLLAPATSLFEFQFHPLQFHRFQSKKRRPKLQSLCQPFPKILLKKISCPWNAESTANAIADYQSRGADLAPDKTTPRQGFQAHLQTCGEHQPGFAKPPPPITSLIWASEQWISAAAGLGSNWAVAIWSVALNLITHIGHNFGLVHRFRTIPLFPFEFSTGKIKKPFLAKNSYIEILAPWVFGWNDDKFIHLLGFTQIHSQRAIVADLSICGNCKKERCRNT